MVKLLNWLHDKRRHILTYFEQKNPPCRPAKEWWIEMYAVKKTVNRSNIMFKELQGKQEKHLAELASDLMQMGGVVSTSKR